VRVGGGEGETTVGGWRGEMGRWGDGEYFQ